VLESALKGELTDHLGHEPGERAEGGRDNYRDGYRSKTVINESGPVEIAVPRDRAGSFEPQLVKKRQRRLGGVDDMVLSLSAKGPTHGETSAHLAEMYGADISFRRLVHAGLLPGLSRRDMRVMIPLNVVQALGQRQHALLDRLDTKEIAVLRAEAAKPVQEPDRDWIGFAAALAPGDLLAALRGWWRCDPASIAAGGVLPVALSGYVVAVLTGLDRWQRNDEGRHGVRRT
jgi:hypothetical protein